MCIRVISCVGWKFIQGLEFVKAFWLIGGNFPPEQLPGFPLKPDANSKDFHLPHDVCDKVNSLSGAPEIRISWLQFPGIPGGAKKPGCCTRKFTLFLYLRILDMAQQCRFSEPPSFYSWHLNRTLIIRRLQQAIDAALTPPSLCSLDLITLPSKRKHLVDCCCCSPYLSLPNSTTPESVAPPTPLTLQHVCPYKCL